jgi:vancomycin permeability regulator SanA
MSAQLPEGFELNAQGLVVTSIEQLDEYCRRREVEARIKAIDEALAVLKNYWDWTEMSDAIKEDLAELKATIRKEGAA